MNALFKKTALFFVKRFDKTKLRKKDKDQIFKLIDLVHPDDIIVKETFKKGVIMTILYLIYLMTL